MNETGIKKLPHWGEPEALKGYTYVGEADNILNVWEYLKSKQTNDEYSLLVGTNFDLSDKIDSINRNKKLQIIYDHLHRVMLFYDDKQHDNFKQQLRLEEFKKYIGVD